VEARGERVEIGRPCPRIGPAGVKQHERLARAVLVVPGANVAKIYVAGHYGYGPAARSSLIGKSSSSSSGSTPVVSAR
jgi:hypothetical protein